MPQQTPARVCLGDFPDEILSLIFSHVDTATLLGAVPNVCRGWRTACGDDVYGPKVRLELRPVQQVLRIRYECLGLWFAATVRRFSWVIKLDLRECDVEDGFLKCVGKMPRITNLDLSCCIYITDTGLRLVAQLMQLTSLNLYKCYKITDTGLENLVQLTQLTSLNLYECYKITNKGLKHVAKLMQLTHLILEGCYITGSQTRD